MYPCCRSPGSDHTLPPTRAGLLQAQRAVASFVAASPLDLVFLPNATAAVNTVLRSLRLAKGEVRLTRGAGSGRVWGLSLNHWQSPI